MTAPVPARPSKVDAINRAGRTFVQGLAVDVATTVVMVAANQLGEVRWTRAYWIALGTLLTKTALITAASYVHGRLRPANLSPKAL